MAEQAFANTQQPSFAKRQGSVKYEPAWHSTENIDKFVVKKINSGLRDSVESVESLKQSIGSMRRKATIVSNSDQVCRSFITPKRNFVHKNVLNSGFSHSRKQIGSENPLDSAARYAANTSGSRGRRYTVKPGGASSKG